MIASNGVNGTAATAGRPASGIQGDFGLSLFQVGRLPEHGQLQRALPLPSRPS